MTQVGAPPDQALLLADLHGSLSAPVLDAMTFLNEVVGRFPDAISFAPGRPTEGGFEPEDLARHLQTYTTYLEKELGWSRDQVRTQLFQYGRTSGIIRELIARTIANDEGIQVPPEAIVVTTGCQEALLLTLRALFARPEDTLLVSSPCYVGITGAAQLLGIRVRPVPEGPAGPDPEAVLAAVHASRQAGENPRAFYVVPDFGNPSGASMSPAARRRLLKDRGAMTDLIRRAESAGYRALVLTVDAPRVAFRPRDAHNEFVVPPEVRAVNISPEVMAASHRSLNGQSAVARHSREQFDASITWEDLAWLRGETSLPVVLKGVLTGEDAELAVKNGVSGLVVSNHGGRQLDFAKSAPECLTEVVDAAGGRCQVILDGGIRHGADVAKALCMGADAVMIGRPALWGLSHSGAKGVAGVLRLLIDEFEEVMALTGAPSVADFGRSGVSYRG